MNKRSSPNGRSRPRVLVAGLGNEIRGDDSFGLAAVRALVEGDTLPPTVRVVELGIGGVGLVHELMDGYDALVIVDAVNRGGTPGTLYVLETEVPDVSTFSPMEQREVAADMHQAVPGRALLMAQAAGVLPPIVRMIGCQPAETDEVTTELSPAVQKTVPKAVGAIRTFLRELAGHRTFEQSSPPLREDTE